MKAVYVVYHIGADDLDVIEIFANYADAKAYVQKSDKKCRIWERPLIG